MQLFDLHADLGYAVLKNDKMKFQLRMIRLIMVLCIGVSVFCKLCE